MNIKELIKNKAEIIKLKKAQLKKGDIISFDTKAQITTKADANTPDSDTPMDLWIVTTTFISKEFSLNQSKKTEQKSYTCTTTYTN